MPSRALAARAAEHGRAAHAAVSRSHPGHPDATPTQWSRPRVQVMDGGGSAVPQARHARIALRGAEGPAVNAGGEQRGIFDVDEDRALAGLPLFPVAVRSS